MNLEQFKQKYYEEVTDLLDNLEQSILGLEQDPANIEIISEVFRVMHTIKGTSGMYEYKVVADVTHKIENVYGKIRDNKLSATKEVVSITFEGIDLIRILLDNNDKCDEVQLSDYLSRLSVVTSMLSTDDEDAALNAALLAAANAEKEPQASNDSNEGGFFLADDSPSDSQEGESTGSTYFIQFNPLSNVQDRGVNIKATLEEIEALGTAIIMPRNSSDAQTQNGAFYMFWEIIFSSKCEYSEIEEVFMFVADEVKITKLADKDLLLEMEFIARCEDFQASSEAINLKMLVELASKFAKVDPSLLEGKPQTENKPEKEQKKSIEDDIAELPANQQTSQEIAKSNQIVNRTVNSMEHKTQSLKVDSDKLDELMNLVSELVTTKAEMLIVAEKYQIPELDSICEKIDRLANNFKDNALSIRLMPIESMMLRFERLVRDLSHELGKKIDFVTDGTDTELDKTIVDNLSIPLMHIIRNSIDHGIEKPERRRELKKKETGLIKFTAFYSGSNVLIQVQDDGAGMNPEILRKKGIEKGLIKPDQKLSERELYDLVFLPGFSTAQSISEISGRGVGMDAVKQSIVNLRGEIEMDSEVNLGTITTIKLPLTLSIVDALLVQVSTSKFLVPVYLIDGCTQVRSIDLEGKDRIVYENDTIPFLDLGKLFEFPKTDLDVQNIVVVKYNNDQLVGLSVDKVIGEHQSVLKPLGRFFKEQEYISGGSILGDGTIALILDVNKLIKQLE